MLVAHALPLFSQPGPVAITCSRGKGRWLCELNGWIVAHLPVNMQGPVVALTGLVGAAFMLYLTWLLLRPLFTSTAKHDSTTTGTEAPRRRSRHIAE